MEEVYRMSFAIPRYEKFTYDGPLEWDKLSEEVRSDFTLGGRVGIRPYFIGNEKVESYTWTADLIYSTIEEAKRRGLLQGKRTYGDDSILGLYKVLDKYSVVDKDVLVIGSQLPWIECVTKAFGARTVTTVDFIPIQCHVQDVIKTVTVDELRGQFDMIFSFSSMEHDGLGRYGDPIHPYGDVLRMKVINNFLKPNGLYVLSVPCGKDLLVYNAHRIYGNVRFPMLIEDYNLLDTICFYGSKERPTHDIFNIESNVDVGSGGMYVDPWFVLSAKSNK
jgi:hypothetical protein